MPGIYNAHMSDTKKRILFMDDEPIIRDVASEMLRFLGYDVIEADRGEEALELYSKALEEGNPFDLIIMDLTIPGGMGARETIKPLLEMDPNVKAAVSSGWTQDPAVKNPREFGFIGVVAKPYDIDDMEICIAKILES